VGEISKSQVDAAGELLREWVAGRADGDLDGEPLSGAVGTLLTYRRTFTAPSRDVESELAGFLTDLAVDFDLTGRPKRAGAIVEKLFRHHGMRLRKWRTLQAFASGSEVADRRFNAFVAEWNSDRRMQG